MHRINICKPRNRQPCVVSFLIIIFTYPFMMFIIFYQYLIKLVLHSHQPNKGMPLPLILSLTFPKRDIVQFPNFVFLSSLHKVESIYMWCYCWVAKLRVTSLSKTIPRCVYARCSTSTMSSFFWLCLFMATIQGHQAWSFPNVFILSKNW